MHAQSNSRTRSRLTALAFAFCTTMIALPSAAVVIPDVPLQSGQAYPPANVMFILDDSGSMAWDFMPGASSSSEVPSTSPVNIALTTYARNTLYYNPSLNYLPWIKADNTRYTGGMSYSSAYSDDSQLSSSTNLGSGTRTFYAPKDGATNLGNTASYYRYQITPAGGDMVRSEYNTIVSGTNNGSSTLAQTTTGNNTTVIAMTVPTNATQLTVTSSGGSYGTNGNMSNGNGSGAQMYVRFNGTPSTTVYDCRSTNGNNNESCTINDPTPGTWYVMFNANSSFKNVDFSWSASYSNRCGGGGTNGNTDWVNCTSATPQYRDATNTLVSRSLSDELVNYATWYSYHRTRIKVAKAGASEAFSRLAGSSLRVGYDSIWNRSPLNIPVGTSNGVFSGTNRNSWFSKLHAADASDGTPLKGALQRAGEYFSNASATGPWGPETGANQLSCRQNFAILTTDGYWNNMSGYPTGERVGDSDGVDGTAYTSADGKETLGYKAETPYIDNVTGGRANTLADVANYYWKTDLRGLDNNVPKSTADPAFWQHMTTFGVSIGLQGRLDPKTDLPGLTSGGTRWPNPLDNEDADRIDDLWHASVNGHGSFVVAKNPVEFARALVEALATVEARNGSASNVTANTTSFVDGARIYQARYVSGKWTGELSAFDASPTGAAPTPAWTGSTGIALAGRRVYTWDGANGQLFPTGTQTTALTRTAGVAPISGADNADYIKGVRTKEIQNNGDQRNRASLLGDIVNSSPMYVTDTNTIYVGANDGMLHAFNAANGTELWAYVPNSLNWTNLSNYSDPQYVHKYFVDGPVVVSSRKQTPGQNLLVGTLGRGGKGVFSLDVTNPTTFGIGDVKWEIGATDADMGMVTGDPLIVKLNDTGNTKAVIFGNGMNSTNGHSVLYVVNLATGNVIRRIDTGVAGDNGLSEPRGRDIDGNGTVDYVYAGDLKGNLWKFDLSAGTTSTWAVAGNRPLYKARSGQAITAGVAIARNPLDGRAWVFFGTGRYLEFSDNSDMTTQAIYGVQDLADGQTVGESELQTRTIAVFRDEANTKRDTRAFEKSAPLPSGKKGWFVNLSNPSVGERVIVRPQMRGATLVFSSMVPPVAATCAANGSGWISAIDAFSGTATSEAYFDVNQNGSFNDVPADKLTDTAGNLIGVGSVSTDGGAPTKGVFIGNTMFFSKTDGSDGSEVTNGGGGLSRRVQWREILQD